MEVCKMSKERQISNDSVETSHPTLEALVVAPESQGGLTMDELSADAEKAVWSTAYKNALPDSAFLYIESGGKKDQDGKTAPRSLRHFPVVDADGKPDAIHLRNAISQASKAKDKDGKLLSPDVVGRVQSKARKMLDDLKKESDVGFWRMLYTKARDRLFGAKQEIDKPFFVWKDAVSGRFWWFAIYSNNYRDNDNPPEILSAEAHKHFVKMVDSGEWPMPELWLWHIPGSRVGEARFVAYDESNGFAMSAGVFDEDKEATALRLSEMDDIGVSHGMPASSIQRDANDPLTLIRYRTREISPLPLWAAANKSTGFLILQKEQGKMISDEKVKFLKDLGLDVDNLEGSLKNVAEMLQAAGVPSKEVSEEVVDVEEQAAESAAEVEDAKEASDEEVSVEDEAPVSAPVVSDPAIVAAAVQVGIEAALTELTGALKAINDRLNAIEAKDAEMEELSPAASFTDLLRSAVIGAKETKVDGRTSFAKDGPSENPNVAKSGGDTPFDVVNVLKTGGDWRSTLN